MGLREILNKLTIKRPTEVYADNETRDRYLRSLRRERRVQMEQEEKKMLIRQIAAYKKAQSKKIFHDPECNILKEKQKYYRRLRRSPRILS